MPKKTTSQWLAPHLEGHSPEEVHGIFIGFKLGLKYAKEEIDDYIKKNDKPAN
jgi:hypothetical protein